jgi:acetyl-CoA carboxylase carboxyltransferase component
LGGAVVHGSKSGVTHLVVDNETEGLLLIRKLLSYLPQNNLEDPPIAFCDDPIDRLDDNLNEIIPENPNKPYDVKDIIHSIIDYGEFMEIHRNYAQNIVVGFARFNGMPVGIIANQPNYLAGVLDINSSRKAARFIRFCDAFNVPVVTLEDVPGFLPGTAQEYGGIITNGAKLLYAYGEATVPKITIILRKAYGGAYCVMSSKHLRGDLNYAWPQAEIAVMGPKGAIEVLHSKEIAKMTDEKEREEFIAHAEYEYKREFANPYTAARLGYIDDVIEPRNTRFRIIRALQALATKKDVVPAKKHSNFPL